MNDIKVMVRKTLFVPVALLIGIPAVATVGAIMGAACLIVIFVTCTIFQNEHREDDPAMHEGYDDMIGVDQCPHRPREE